jgi:ADP-heptose:LPS heptosyltransferase
MCEKNLGVLRYLGIENPPIQYDYIPGSEALNFVKEFMRNRNVTGKIIGMYVSGSAAIQKWPLKKFLELGKKLIEDLEVAVLIIWGPEDSEVISDISKDPLYSEKLLVAPPTSVDQMGAFIHSSSLFITGDGGPKHMSVALNIPTLTIYGGIDAKYWNPPDLKRFPIITSEIHCYPCGDKRNCRYQTYECLHSITVPDVQREVKKLAKEFI